MRFEISYVHFYLMSTYLNLLGIETLVTIEPLDQSYCRCGNCSLEIIKKENPKFLYFTHFGKFSYKENEIINLQNTLKEWLIWVKKNRDQNETILIEKFKVYIKKSLKSKLVDDQTIEQYCIANPPYMSILGLKRVLIKKNYDKA